jgi:hypothetical protein
VAFLAFHQLRAPPETSEEPLLKAADGELATELSSAIRSGDDYVSAAKSQIDRDDNDAQAELVDSRAKAPTPVSWSFMDLSPAPK